MRTRALLEAIDARKLHLIVLPTEQCNFRCVYCYEDFAVSRMAPTVIDAIKGFLKQRLPHLSELTVSWFGGEPLLAHDIVFDIMSYVACNRHADLSYSSDMTTNGYKLTPEILEKLVALNVRNFQVSVDGPAEQHDAKRPLANGRGTFERIWQNLVSAKQLKETFHINVRVHLDRENIDSMMEFLRTFASEFASDRRFALYLRHVSKLGGARDSELPVLHKEELSRVASLRTFAESLGLRTVAVKDAEYICYAVKPNSFVVRADGRLAKCTVAFNSEYNNIGKLLPDGRLEIDHNKLPVWMKGLASGERSELLCPLNSHVRKMSEDASARTIG